MVNKIFYALNKFLWKYRFRIFIISLIFCLILLIEILSNYAFRDIFPIHFRPFWYNQKVQTTIQKNDLSVYDSDADKYLDSNLAIEIFKKKMYRITCRWKMNDDYLPDENGHQMGYLTEYYDSNSLLYNLMWNSTKYKAGDTITIRYKTDKDYTDKTGKYKAYIVGNGHYTIFGVVMLNIFYLAIIGLVSSIWRYIKLWIMKHKRKTNPTTNTDIVITYSNENYMYEETPDEIKSITQNDDKYLQ